MLKVSVASADASNEAKVAAWGASPKLRFYTGGAPATCAAPATGTFAAEGVLPVDPMAASANGVIAKLGTWTVTGLAAAGGGVNVGYFRIYDNAGAVCHEQGTLTAVGGGGDMTIDNVSVAHNQVVTVNSHTLTDGNL